MTFFGSIDLLPNDSILHLNVLYAKDQRTNKVNLGVGVYHDTDGKIPLFDCVQKAEERIHLSKQNKNYLPIDGLPGFIEKTLNLIYGDQQSDLQVYGAQALGGTGALRIGSEFLVQNCCSYIAISKPSWPNHGVVLSYSDMKVSEYPYYDIMEGKILFPELCQYLSMLAPGSAVLLQACCHNPTGADFTNDQWREIAQIIKQYKLMPFFDFAYQGFGVDFQQDAFAPRLFLAEGIEHLTAYSFSKNMGLYGERVGLIAIASNKKCLQNAISSQIKQMVRGMYSMPPLHGAQIVNTVIDDPFLTESWQNELKSMQQRIQQMREELVEGLKKSHLGSEFSYLSDRKGLFSFCRLSLEQVMQLRDQFAIYLPPNGRINVAGLNKKNMDYVISALLSVISP